DILEQTKSIQFNYLIHSMAFPFTKIIAHVLHLPTISSLAVFAGLKGFFNEDEKEAFVFPGMENIIKMYADVSAVIHKKYNYEMPKAMIELLLNKSELNFVYTSE